MMKPVDITFENKYLLKRELETVNESEWTERIDILQEAGRTQSVLNRNQRHDSAGEQVDNINQEDDSEELQEDQSPHD